MRRSSRSTDRYYVYVFEAHRAGKVVLYVGQSAKTPSVRLREHAEGHRYCEDCTSRRYVRGSLRLRADLYRGLNPIATRTEALRAERELARKLRKLGFEVKGGH